MIYSREGTTHWDPLAMAIFAIAVRPLIDRLTMAQATQIWFADDSASGGKLQALSDALLRFGPLFGYHVNVSKSWLLVTPENLQEATTFFADTGLKITTGGIRHRVGAPLGDPSFRESFVNVTKKVFNWKNELHHLAEMTHRLLSHTWRSAHSRRDLPADGPICPVLWRTSASC